MSDRGDRQKLLDFGRVFDHLPVGFCVFDADLRYVYANEALAALDGVSSQNHLGRTILEILPHVAPLVMPALHQVMETGEPVVGGVVEAKTQAAPGEMRAFQYTYTVIKGADHAAIGVSCLVQDVTDQRQVQVALEKATNGWNSPSMRPRSVPGRGI